MKVELLHIADCPNTAMARQLLVETLRELKLPEEIQEIEVCDEAQAEALNFPGSPTIRVNGIDVETSLPGQNSLGLSCRVYMVSGRLLGIPTSEMIRETIQSAVPAGERKTKRS
jgi:hypothetical protein